MAIECSLFTKYRFQFISALCANIIAIAHGAGIGWLSPTLLLLQSSETPLASGPLNIDEASWLGSLICVGGLTGNLAFGFVANRWGRKRALSLIAFPQMCFWIIISLSNDVIYLYIGRILAGMTGGGCFVAIPLFISDIASKEVRGSLGSFLMLSVNVGTLFGYVIGAYLPYSIVPMVIIILPITYFCLIILVPETPQFLLQQGDDEAAKRSICFYRNLDLKSASNDINLKIAKEMEEIKSVMGIISMSSVSFKDLVAKDARRSMFLGVGLVAVYIFSGIFFIVSYNATIFKAAGVNIAPNDAALIVGVSQIAGTYMSYLIIDHLRRKTLLVLTISLTAIGHMSVGLSTYLAQFYDLSHLSWLPVLSLSLLVFSASLGFIPATFVVLNEVIPRNVRAITASICNGALNVFAFTSLKVLPMLISYAGLHMVMWFCSGMCFLGILFYAVCIPETRGKVI